MSPWALSDPGLVARVRELAAARRSDRQIAAELGCHWSSVFKCRERHGIPAGYDPRGPRAYAARARGLNAGHRAQRRERDALAARYGLPEGLTGRQVQILLALAGGPLTRVALARRLGCGSRFGTGSYKFGREHDLLTDLKARGLVAAVARIPAAGRGRLPNLYHLTPLALDYLSKGGA